MREGICFSVICEGGGLQFCFIIITHHNWLFFLIMLKNRNEKKFNSEQNQGEIISYASQSFQVWRMLEFLGAWRSICFLIGALNSFVPLWKSLYFFKAHVFISRRALHTQPTLKAEVEENNLLSRHSSDSVMRLSVLFIGCQSTFQS